MTDWAYILSPSYSGSTLLTFLLAGHPEVATIGELKASAMGDVDSYVCSCGMRIRECSFWQRVGEELAHRRLSFDLSDFGTRFRLPKRPLADRFMRSRFRGRVFESARDLALRVLPGARRGYRRIIDRNRTLSEVILHIQGGTIFLDGSKEPIRLKYLLGSAFCDIKVIYLIRDGRGTANSYMKHYSTSMPTAAREWRLTHEAIDRLVSCLPAGSWIKVHYEELCRDADGTLASIFAFLGLDAARAVRDYQSVEHHILGNSMRLRGTSEIRLDEKWKATLTPTDIETFQRLAGDLNRRYGYT